MNTGWLSSLCLLVVTAAFLTGGGRIVAVSAEEEDAAEGEEMDTKNLYTSRSCRYCDVSVLASHRKIGRRGGGGGVCVVQPLINNQRITHTFIIVCSIYYSISITSFRSSNLSTVIDRLFVNTLILVVGFVLCRWNTPHVVITDFRHIVVALGCFLFDV